MSQTESWRVALIGGRRVGKTTFAQQWALDYGIVHKTERGIEHRKLVFADNVPSIVYLLDSRPLNFRLTQYAHAYLLMYSISDRSTFEAIPNLRGFIQRSIADSNAAFILIGNTIDTNITAKPYSLSSPSTGLDQDGKRLSECHEQIRDSFEIMDSDTTSQETFVAGSLDREVSTEEGSALAQRLGCSAFLEISTLLGEDVETTIQQTIKHLRATCTGSSDTGGISWIRGVCGKVLGGGRKERSPAVKEWNGCHWGGVEI